MQFEELYPNRFLSAADLEGKDRTYSIAGARAEEMVGIKGTQWKAVITFVGEKKEFVANRTNGEAIKLMFGRDVEKWIGKRVTLFPTEVSVVGSVEPCIRVRGSPDIDQPMKAEVKRGQKTLKISVAPTGKTNGSAPKSPSPSVKPAGEPGPVEKIGKLLDAAGITDKAARVELVKQATNKSKRTEFNEDDVGRVQQVLADMKAEPPAPPPPQNAVEDLDFP